MGDDTWKHPEEGELLWQSRMPGGVCMYLSYIAVKEGDRWETYYKVLHPSEGLIDDPSYYYLTLEEEEKLRGRHGTG
jgi:hypothetical protein|tara:strand:+ start:3532 stop:3762 length:231 start_codon:yes stop_codon:yes gene_type:complete